MIKGSRKKWIYNPITLIIFAGIFTQLILPWIISIIGEVSYVQAFNTVWMYVTYPVGIPLIVAIVCGIFILIVIAKQFPIFRCYNKDLFYDAIYKWHYSHYISGAKAASIYISGPFCPLCDAESEKCNRVQYDNGEKCWLYKCDRCRLDFKHPCESHEYTRHRIEKEVRRRLRTGEWRTYFLKRVLGKNTNENFGIADKKGPS